MRTIWYLALAGLALTILSFGVLVADAADKSSLEKMQDQMFGVTVQIDRNCSGSIIHSERDDESGKVLTVVLTAKHCVSKSPDREYSVVVPIYEKNRIIREVSYKAKVRGQYYKADLALIELKDTQTFFAKTAKIAAETETFVMGEDVWTVGYPLGMAMTVTPGAFGSLETVDFPTPGMEYLRATPNIAPGNSGGALYHQNAAGDYTLIGVTTAGIQSFPWINLYTPLSAIHEYLEKALPAEPTVVKASGI